jgi:hypothetical protein
MTYKHQFDSLQETNGIFSYFSMTARGSNDDEDNPHHHSHQHDSRDKFKRERYSKESGRGRYDRYRNSSRDKRGRSRSPERYERRRSKSRSPERSGRRFHGRGTGDHGKSPSMDYLMNFKQFLETQPSHMEEDEAVKKYAQYKEAFQSKHVKTFFEQHKEEEWLKEEYHPIYLKGKKERVLQTVREHYATFMEEYNKGMYDHVNLDRAAHGITGATRQSKFVELI